MGISLAVNRKLVVMFILSLLRLSALATLRTVGSVGIWLVLSTSVVFGAWFDPAWHYRVPIAIPVNTAVNSTVKVDVNFAAMLSNLGVAGTFDVNSPRIARANGVLSSQQQYADTLYAGATDAVNNSQGEIRFILQDSGPVTYFLYFDTTANGVKSANPATPINGNFEFGSITGISPQTPPGWQSASRSNPDMQAQMRPSELVAVTEPETVDIPNMTVITNGSPNTGAAAYLQGFRNSADTAGVATLTKSITVPASNPGVLNIRIRPEGWDSSQNGNLAEYDFIRVRLLNASNAVVLNVVGPELNNYSTCPFGPNYSINLHAPSGHLEIVTDNQPGYGVYNYWDNGLIYPHGIGMSAQFGRGNEPWITCSASLASLAGQTLTLEIRTQNEVSLRSWFLIDDVEWSVVTGALGTPIAYNPPLTPAKFNCVEAGDNGATGRLFTKLVGTSFDFDVVALNASGSVETNFVTEPLVEPDLPPPPPATKPVTVELVDGSSSTACDSRIPISPAVTQVLSFTPQDLGRKRASPIQVNHAFPNVRCRVTDDNESPRVVGCSADNFSIRPTALNITANVVADLTGSSVSATPAIKAGAPFTLTASSNSLGYNSTPLIDSSKVQAHAGAAQTGLVAGSFNAADPSTGVATASTFNYNEIGYFRFDAYGVYDDGFTNVDVGTDCTDDFSNTAISGRFGCKFGNPTATGYFGRFIPDHFRLLPGLTTPACNAAFTYFGQDGFSTAFTLVAQNAANTTTQNYGGNFARLGLNNWANFGFTAPALPTGAILSNSATLPSGVWVNGSAAIITKHKVSRPTDLVNETSITINAAPVDLDGVTMSASGVATLTKLRYGRMALQNAHGSELLDLPMTMQAEYWNGSSWVANSEDVCTNGIAFSLSDPVLTDSLAANALCIWDTGSSGSSGLGCPVMGNVMQQFKQPPALGNFNLNFKAPGIGKTGALDVTAIVPNYLQFNWKGLGDVNPSARATFGVYKGQRGTIYFREMY